MTGREERRAAYEQAKRAGCTCRPDVASLPGGLIEVRHDADCPMSTAGQTAILTIPGRNGILSAFDLTQAIHVAEMSNVIVVSVNPPAMIVPSGVDVPPTMAEFGDIERIERPSGAVRVCTLSDAMVAGMMAQVGL